MSRKLQIRFIFLTHVLAFAAVVETLFLVDVTVDDFGANCRKFSQETHFANPRYIKDQILIPRSSVFTNFEKGKKALLQAETPISDG